MQILARLMQSVPCDEPNIRIKCASSTSQLLEKQIRTDDSMKINPIRCNQTKNRDCRAVQRSALCRSRRELPHEYLVAKVGFDTAENEPSRLVRCLAGRSPRHREERRDDRPQGPAKLNQWARAAVFGRFFQQLSQKKKRETLLSQHEFARSRIVELVTDRKYLRKKARVKLRPVSARVHS